MTSLFRNSPTVKDSSAVIRYIVAAFSFIGSIFILSPAIVFLIKKTNPLTEMPDNSIYFTVRALFGILLLVSGLLYCIYKKLSVTILPALSGMIAVIFPLIYRINKYKEYKNIIERSSMTADYAPYLANIGVYIIILLLCVTYIIYCLGVFRFNIPVLVFSALSATAVLFLTVDKAKTVEYNIYNVYDILSFAYGILVCIIPIFIIFTTQRATPTKQKNVPKKYIPRRMK